MKTKRNTFRAANRPFGGADGKNVVNESFKRRRKARADALRHNHLYDPQRERSATEIETMTRAAIKHPGGKADLMLKGLKLGPYAKKPRAKKTATVAVA